ncbi:MAG: hypothetical protein LBI53_02370 [Candidatus Peribacteria bacterium]|nr:hypothetical protein [Candidatus Peribacteria bacterium]
MIGLLLQFFLQTFITFQLGRNGTFRSFIRMWKEFVLLLLIIAVSYACFQHLPQFLKELKKSEEKNTRSTFWKFFKKQALLQYLLTLVITSIIFLLIAIFIQKLSLGTFLFSFKYDLLPFFILGIGACLGVLFLTEEDQELIVRYQKIMRRCLYGGLLRRMLVYFMPNGLKFF